MYLNFNTQLQVGCDILFLESEEKPQSENVNRKLNKEGKGPFRFLT